jgi:hypothetical protein
MSKVDLKTLTADIRGRNIGKEANRITEKWNKTGLLKGLKDVGGNMAKSNMARLLENQAAELLKESSEVSDIKGFQNIAFPIVRRVFGGLIANELVSVQPMSLPSGLLFYLDYTFANANKAGNQNLDWTSGGSVYGDQTDPGSENLGTGGHYYLNSAYSDRELTAALDVQASGAASWADVNYDFELSGAVANSTLWYVDVAFTSSAAYALADLDETNYKNFGISGSDALWGGVKGVYKRHNTFNTTTGVTRLFFSASAALDDGVGITGSFVTKAGLTVDSTGVVLTPAFESDFVNDIIPELDIKVSSVAVTAKTRKLKAKWTPELAQDLNAYHNLDAEVELTQILSEQIAIDIDREILSQLLNDATGATMYWSRKPGDFVNKLTGASVAGASFTGTVREWYETLVETTIDVANTIHRKTLRGAANFMVVSPDVATILENTVLYKPQLSLDPKETQFSLGIEKIGSLTNRFVVYKDPYFPRNLILIGYKGGSFLETGFVYAPYVPLIVTPTIFAPDDFTPRKGVMTRYAKKMVRSDFYGKVVVLNMDVI